MNKLPQITVIFWVIKIAATTLGETGGDLLAQTLDVGYLVSSLLFIGLFLVSLLMQLRAQQFRPALYWTVIVATSTAGTTMSDFLNRTVELGYATGALVLISCLAIVFLVWARSGQTFAVQEIRTFPGELLYWIAILFSNTLGTSLGDFLADDSGLGFGGGALVIAAVMLTVLAAHYLTPISTTFLFWAAFVLTRPLGATVGDFFSKPLEKGGLDLGTVGSSIALLLILIGAIVYSQMGGRSRTGDPSPTLLDEVPAGTPDPALEPVSDSALLWEPAPRPERVPDSALLWEPRPALLDPDATVVMPRVELVGADRRYGALWDPEATVVMPRVPQRSDRTR